MRWMTLVVALIGCSMPSLSTEDQPIIGGTVSTGDSPVVMLAAYPPDQSVLTTCTAVLIAPTVLLTVAHCIDAPTHPSYTYGVFTSADASAYSTLALLEPHLVAVASVNPHPAYNTAPPFVADIGIVILAAPLAVTPLPIQRVALPTTVVGQSAEIIGYGQTTFGSPNQTRFQASTTVVAIDTGDTITVGDAQRHSCLGDSGGPAIVSGTVVGVDSYTDTSGCTGPAHYRRPDLYLDFINQFAPGAGAPDAGAGVSVTGDAGTTTQHSGGGCAAGGGGGLGAALALLGLRRRRRA